MKKQIIIISAMILGLSLVVVVMGTGNQTEVQQPSYTHIQEQGATGSFNSPVIHHTLKQVESAILS